MKMKTECNRLKSFLLCGTALLMALALFSFGHASGETAPRKLTLMVYMCGSNLESQYGSATADYQEMVRAGVDPEVSVLVMMGGSTQWQMDMDASSTAVMEIGSRGSRKVRTAEKMNMGDGDTLSAFLRFGMEYAPAEEYALILWDHGGGPLDGLCWDEQYGADHLSLRELKEALQANGFEDRKLSWIGFDACLMSSLEVAHAMAPCADYMISSQAEEPASGWNYAFLRELSRDASAKETGRRIVDAYFEVEPDTLRDLTLACIDLSGVGSLTDRMNSFFADLSGRMTRDTFADISHLRLSATGFGRAGAIEPGESGYDLVDLVSLIKSYASLSPEKAERVISGVADTVAWQRSNMADSCGLSVYHPWRNRSRFVDTWKDTYQELEFCPEYTRYVDYYGSIMAGETLIRWDDLNRISASRNEDGTATQISAELTEDQIANLASARLVILARNLYDAADESYSLVYRAPESVPEGNWLYSSYDGRHLQAVNGSGYMPLTGALSYRITEEGTYLVRIYPWDGETRRDTPLWAEYVLEDSGTLRLKDYLVYDEMTGTWSSRADTDLSRYPVITFLNEYRNPTENVRGETLSFDQWETDAHQDTHLRARYDEEDTAFQLVFAQELMRAEALYAAFEVTDLQGHQYMTRLIPLEDGGLTEYETRVTTVEQLPLLGDTPLDVSFRLFLMPSTDLGNSRVIINAALRNTSDQDISFLLRDVQLNGTDISAAALSSQGTGSQNQDGRRALAPGETGAASLILRYEDIAPLIPDVSLRQIVFDLYVGEGPEGGSDVKFAVPYALRTDVPLTAFYPETDVLPPYDLVRFGRSMGAMDETSEKLLFSIPEVTVALRGIYVVDRNLVLQLHYENRGSRSRHLFLGRATLDGQEASIGQTRDISAVVRNNRMQNYGLEFTPWKESTGVNQVLEAGMTLDDYVVLRPDDPAQRAARRIAFQALCYDADQPLDSVLCGETVILSEDPAPLEEGIMAVAPAADYQIAPGQPLPKETGISLLKDQIPDAPEAETRTFRVSDPSGERILGGFYYLFRRITSDQELAALNILNQLPEGNAEKRIAFPEGREWLLFEAMGSLESQEDGSSSALFPGVLPAVRTGEETFRLAPVWIHSEAEGEVLYDQVSNHLSFGSADFPGAVLGGTALGYFCLRQETATGRMDFADAKQLDGSWPSLAEIISQRVFLLPGDASEEERLAILNADISETALWLRQYQRMKSEKVSLEMEPLGDPTRYMIVYLYGTESGEIRCTAPAPLE